MGMKSLLLNKPVLILALFACAARADYINSTVILGGYVLDAKDVSHDGNVYQMARVNVSALKNNLELRINYGFSDFYEARPNTYQNSNRLGLANLSYTPGISGLKVKAGRDFMPMIERSLYYDGGAASIQYQNYVKVELFGGYGVPTVYQNDIFNFDSEQALVGGKISFTPTSALQIRFDGLVNGKQDDGSLGWDVLARLGERIRLLGNSVYRLDSSYFQHTEFAVQAQIRKNDLVQIRYGMQQQKIDSTRNYDYFVNKAHQYLNAGYVLSLSNKLSADFDYGLLMYDDTIGQAMSIQVNAYGFFVKSGQEFSTVSNAFDLRVGYSNTYWNRLDIQVAGGYTRYDLNARKTGLEAFDFSLQPSVHLGRGFTITASYEYLANPLYENDQRYFIGVKESFFRGLSK
jgi:hypothetical protein